jgi:AcrR family transcriptional regulator
MADLKQDRRSQRTQRYLIEALVSLIQEKRYDAITVQDIIDRADVGRSTFYVHYQDKEDLMTGVLVHIMELLSQMESPQTETGSPRLLPVREVLEHVQENLQLFKGVMRGHGMELFFEKGQKYWSQKIAAEMQALLPEGQQPAVPVPVMAHFASGTMVMMLRWWLDNKMPYSPREMDDMVHRLVMPGIQNSLAGQQSLTSAPG